MRPALPTSANESDPPEAGRRRAELVRQLRTDAKVRGTRRLVMLTLIELMDWERGEIPAQYTPSLTELSDLAGVSRRTIMRSLRDLESGGYVNRERQYIAPDQFGKTRYALGSQWPYRRVTNSRGVGSPRPGKDKTSIENLHARAPARVPARASDAADAAVVRELAARARAALRRDP